jgi:hypothetical protein
MGMRKYCDLCKSDILNNYAKKELSKTVARGTLQTPMLVKFSVDFASYTDNQDICERCFREAIIKAASEITVDV